MNALAAALGWARDNHVDLVAFAWGLVGFLNAVIPHNGGRLRSALDWIAPLTPAKYQGTVKVPGMVSKPSESGVNELAGAGKKSKD